MWEGRAYSLNESVHSSYTAREKNTCFAPSVIPAIKNSVCPLEEGSPSYVKTKLDAAFRPFTGTSLETAAGQGLLLGLGLLSGLGTPRPLFACEACADT